MIKNELSSPKQNAGIKKTLKKKKVNSNCMQKLHLHQISTLFSSIRKSTVKQSGKIDTWSVFGLLKKFNKVKQL